MPPTKPARTSPAIPMRWPAPCKNLTHTPSATPCWLRLRPRTFSLSSRWWGEMFGRVCSLLIRRFTSASNGSPDGLRTCSIKFPVSSFDFQNLRCENAAPLSASRLQSLFLMSTRTVPQVTASPAHLQGAKLLEAELRKVIRGKDDVIRMALVAVFARGHLLIEGVPGVGKTTLAHAPA